MSTAINTNQTQSISHACVHVVRTAILPILRKKKKCITMRAERVASRTPEVYAKTKGGVWRSSHSQKTAEELYINPSSGTSMPTRSRVAPYERSISLISLKFTIPFSLLLQCWSVYIIGKSLFALLAWLIDRSMSLD